jgi:hypothetical protein
MKRVLDNLWRHFQEVFSIDMEGNLFAIALKNVIFTITIQEATDIFNKYISENLLLLIYFYLAIP